MITRVARVLSSFFRLLSLWCVRGPVILGQIDFTWFWAILFMGVGILGRVGFFWRKLRLGMGEYLGLGDDLLGRS